MSKTEYTRAFLGTASDGTLVVTTAKGDLVDRWGFIEIRVDEDHIYIYKPSIAREVAQHLLAWADANKDLE